jgi:hypothetical protein
VTAFELDNPRPVQVTCGFDRYDRSSVSAISQQLLKQADPLTRHRQRHRRGQQASPVAHPDPINNLARIYGNNHRCRIKGNLQHRHEPPPLIGLRQESAQLRLMTYQLSGV